MATVLIAGSFACDRSDSARSGHAPNAGGWSVSGSFAPRRAEIDDTPIMLGSARIIRRGGMAYRAGVDRQPPCLTLQL
ncbi:hypothetical protein [Nocardia sp.]|uniref:hypothetical protein n=1 Tax=Nocardia sp. TaxID=1821 RepID=UPI00260B15FF|nr:hypothetical protein [Nocardia sp.]